MTVIVLDVEVLDRATATAASWLPASVEGWGLVRSLKGGALYSARVLCVRRSELDTAVRRSGNALVVISGEP